MENNLIFIITVIVSLAMGICSYVFGGDEKLFDAFVTTLLGIVVGIGVEIVFKLNKINFNLINKSSEIIDSISLSKSLSNSDIHGDLQKLVESACTINQNLGSSFFLETYKDFLQKWVNTSSDICSVRIKLEERDRVFKIAFLAENTFGEMKAVSYLNDNTWWTKNHGQNILKANQRLIECRRTSITRIFIISNYQEDLVVKVIDNQLECGIKVAIVLAKETPIKESFCIYDSVEGRVIVSQNNDGSDLGIISMNKSDINDTMKKWQVLEINSKSISNIDELKSIFR